MAFSQAEENYYVDRGLSSLEPNLITKLKLQANIILGEFIFNTIDEDGVTWVVTDIEGWWRHPEPEVPDIPRGWGDGSYDVKGRYTARLFTLQGVFLTPDPALVEAARNKLIAAADLVYKGVWLKTGSNPIRASFVRLAGAPEFTTINARGRTEFSIPLRAADPIKYEWNDQDPEGYESVELPAKNTPAGFSGSASVINNGNYPVPCYLEVLGTLGSPATIYNRTTDQLIIITQGLRGSSSATIVNKKLSFNTESLKDVVTLTSVTSHDFRPGNIIDVSGAGGEFDGEHVITSTPSATTFTYETLVAEIKPVASKKLQNSVATLQTSDVHGFTAGQQVTIKSVDGVFDGDYTILSTPTSNSFTYSKTRIPPVSIISKVLVSNIATLTTSSPHQFLVGETVTISNVDVNFNGSYVITAIPASNQFSYAATRTNARAVINKQMTNDVVTLTTTAAHGFVVGETVNITAVDLSLNGGYQVTTVPSATTFTYVRPRGTQKTVTVKARTGNVATLTTSSAHGFAVGERVTVSGIDSSFNGTFTITSLPSNTTFTFSNSGSDIVSTVVNGGTVSAKSRVVSSYSITGNIVTVSTPNAHGVIFGESVTISGIPAINGTYEVIGIPTTNTFTFSKTASNTASTDVTNAFVEMSGTIPSSAVVPDGTATVGGSLPLASSSGTAGVSDNIAETSAGGYAIKKNDVQFTPGLSGANAFLSPEILEIDTKNREVFYNGEIEGARGRIDVLADFIQLEPGENIIEFEDQGVSDGQANLRILYRSGWIG